MLLEGVLETIRGLVDQAIDDQAHKPASVLSSLVSKLEYALRAERKVTERYTEQSRLDQLARDRVAEFLPYLQRHLSEDDFELAANVIRESLPAPRERDPNIVRVETEVGQVRELLNVAIEARALSDVRKLATLLVAKCKGLTYARVDAGELVDEQFTKKYAETIADAVASARVLVDEDKFNDASCAFAAENEATYGE